MLLAVHTGDDAGKETGRTGGQFAGPLFYRFPQGSHQTWHTRFHLSHVLSHLLAEIGRCEIVVARKQQARESVARIQNVAGSLSECHYIGSGPVIEFGSRKILDGMDGIGPDRLPGIEHVLQSYHDHIVPILGAIPR